MKPPRRFYERDTAKVAQELLGMTLYSKASGILAGGKIVETEAYRGKEDPASRASEKKTKINEIMWDKGGLALVYMVHANWLFNITTEIEGTPGAVLIRALEPTEGIKIMEKRRNRKDISDLTSGPGKLTQALAITNEHHSLDLISSEKIYITKPEEREDIKIKASQRIGVTEDLDRKLRFYVSDSSYVSR